MTLEEYEKKLDAALETLDWKDPDCRESEAHKLLKKAAVDRDVVDTGDWIKLYDRYRKAVARL